MRYLNKRDEFLNSIKIDSYKPLITRINEQADSGPFANDIPWGDSLLGRLIDSTIRKAKIGNNLLKIKSVENRLRDAFDEILAYSKINEDEESKKEVAKLMNFTFLYNLEQSVKKGHDIKIIKNLTNVAISETEKNEEIPERDELLQIGRAHV